MRARLFVSAASMLCLCGVFAAHGQNSEAQALVQKAVKAHGGTEKLTKARAGYFKGKGMLRVPSDIPFTVEGWIQLPDKLKVSMELQVNNMNVPVTQGFDGTKAWLQVAGMTMELNDDKIIQQFKEDLYAETVAGLVDLADKKYQLDLLGESKIMDKTALGLRVSSQGRKDVSLFFDKQTTLLLKIEHRTIDAMSGQEVTQEKYLHDYKDFEGLPGAQRIVVQRDGKAFIEIEVTEARHQERLDDTLFAKP